MVPWGLKEGHATDPRHVPEPMTGAALPTVLERVSGPGETFTLAIGADLIAFRGHFPGNPVLPGVVQVDWAIRFGT